MFSFIDTIKNCTQCPLSSFQKPILDVRRECDVMWLGLSAKIEAHDFSVPLDPRTNSGKILAMIEASLPDVTFYSSNLVKCAPLTENKKLRYPVQSEISACSSNLDKEREMLHPKIIILLGDKVTSAVCCSLQIKIQKRKKDFDYAYVTHKDIVYLSVPHPSYMYVYKHEHIAQYVAAISSRIIALL